MDLSEKADEIDVSVEEESDNEEPGIKDVLENLSQTVCRKRF